MKVLLVATSDWANAGNTYAAALRSVGVAATMVVSSKHRFRYPDQPIMWKHNIEQVKKLTREADIIQIMHSFKPDWLNIKNKKVVVFHGGGKYRTNSKAINKIFNPIVEMSIIQTPDLLGRGAKNERWVMAPVNTNLLLPVYGINSTNNVVIGHYPSSRVTKGSDNILKVITKLKNKHKNIDYRYSYDPVIWKAYIKKMSECDIYIERMMIPKKYNVKAVCSITAIEAAALGKLVITNFSYVDLYEKEYGKFGLYVANSEEEMEQMLDMFLSMPKERLLKYRTKCRKWAEKFHSYEAIGNRLKKCYEEIL